MQVKCAGSGRTAITFGNVVGSNIANIGLILGLTAIIRTLEIHRSIVTREIPIMLVATAGTILLGSDWLFGSTPDVVDSLDGVLLLFGFVVFLALTVRGVGARMLLDLDDMRIETAEQTAFLEEHPMTARTSSLVHPKYKTKYSVGNWPEYERGLRARGDVMIWFNQDATAGWIPCGRRKRGAQPLYSDLAIETSLTLGLVFHLPLRQTEGFVGSLLG